MAWTFIYSVVRWPTSVTAKQKSHGKAKTTTKLKSHGKTKKPRQNKKATAK